MDAEDWQDKREQSRKTDQQWFKELHDTVFQTPENKGKSTETARCYLCRTTEDLHWCDRKPGFWLCGKCGTKPAVELNMKIKDGAECPF